jgi:DNA-directed RNA polymerase beta subunit
MYIKTKQRFNKYLISDFVEIQRKSFFTLLEKGIIEEFSKRNPITNTKKTMELFFYPDYYQLTPPEYTPTQAIIKSKSYTARLYIPVQLTNKTFNIIKLKWVYIGDIPLMTKRGHFILNGCARVIVNQMIRSPGIYYQKKVYENFFDKWSEKPENTFTRYYADLICNRGTWLRIEMDKYNKIWAQMKRVPKIPIMWFLISVGLTDKIVLKNIMDSKILLYNLQEDPLNPQKKILPYVKTPPAAWTAIYNIVFAKKNKQVSRASRAQSRRADVTDSSRPDPEWELALCKSETEGLKEPLGLRPGSPAPNGSKDSFFYLRSKPTFAMQKFKEHAQPKGNTQVKGLTKQKQKKKKDFQNLNYSELMNLKNSVELKAEQGRRWIFNKFMNPRTYDLGEVGRLNINRKLKLSISKTITTLTPQDFLAATNYLILVSKGLRELDDIDHLKNRRIRTSGELIQMQIGVGLVRLEKIIREKMNKIQVQLSSQNNLTKQRQSLKRSSLEEGKSSPSHRSSKKTPQNPTKHLSSKSKTNKKSNTRPNLSIAQAARVLPKPEQSPGSLAGQSERLKITRLSPPGFYANLAPDGSFSSAQVKGRLSYAKVNINFKQKYLLLSKTLEILTISNLINTKPFNGALREFFGTSPLSQFMDQINPLAELTHKRRLSSMGPGGVTRDSATLAIRGIHPSHYGRICPVETPEGKNTGLVNSLTAYARVNSEGYIETPFYRVYKGQVQKKTGLYFFSAKQEEKIRLGAADLYTSNINFLPKASIPVRIVEDFIKIARNEMQYVGVAPIQMISIATSLIPFFEHDDANRALMGSNMQRQAVPILKPQRPIVGTGLEARAVSDSGHAVTSKYSGIITYVSSNKILIYSLN